MSKLTLIVGRSGSGKDTLVGAFEKLGLSSIKSYTTRPPRNSTDTGHIFIKDKDVEIYPNKIATATINGYMYFATREQVDNHDLYVINPDAIPELIKNIPDVQINIIYIMTKNNNKRREMAISRAEDKIKETDIFDKRDNDENDQFTRFENRIRNNEKINGVAREIVFLNDYQQASVNNFAKWCMGRII